PWEVVLPASHRVSRVPWYSGSVSEGEKFRLQDCYLLWLPFPGAIRLFFTFVTPCETVLQPQKPLAFGLGCFPFARRYSGNRGCFLFLRVLRCFSSPGCPHSPYGFR